MIKRFMGIKVYTLVNQSELWIELCHKVGVLDEGRNSRRERE